VAGYLFKSALLPEEAMKTNWRKQKGISILILVAVLFAPIRDGAAFVKATAHTL